MASPPATSSRPGLPTRPGPRSSSASPAATATSTTSASGMRNRPDGDGGEQTGNDEKEDAPGDRRRALLGGEELVPQERRRTAEPAPHPGPAAARRCPRQGPNSPHTGVP